VRRPRALIDAAGMRFRALWEGETRALPLALFRIGLAAIILVRTTPLARGWIELDHHAWTRGSEFSPGLEAVAAPRLHSPLLPLPELPDAWVDALVNARGALALLLLLGLRTRWVALALFVVGYGLMALDRYRYFHHMHLLWTSCLWLALARAPRLLSIEQLWSKGSDAITARWPLQLLRAQCLIVYAAAGIAKLRPSWLSGAALEAVAQARLVGGPLWDWSSELLGVRGVALGVAASELAIALLLALPRLRLFGIALALALHWALGASMVVSTFGVQMALYLLLFLPWSKPAREVTRN
jgi:hypothetical protein